MGEPPSTKRLTGEKKLIAGGGGGERSSVADNYILKHLFVKSICVYCRKMKRF
jgi:hypothetical protein